MSKRALYKSASQNVGNQERRRVLAQGRLVTSESASQKTQKNPSLAQGTQADGSIISTVQHSPTNEIHNISTPRKDLASLMQGGHHEDDSLNSPRREQPSLSVSESPKLAKPSKSLDLSDSEDEVVFTKPQNRCVTPTEVLVVDASRQTKTPDDSEVNISVGFAHSPARVVCHSPSSVAAKLRRTTGDVEEAAKVEVDAVPTVTIPLVIRESEPKAAKAEDPVKKALFTRMSSTPPSTKSHSLDGNDSTDFAELRPIKTQPAPKPSLTTNIKKKKGATTIPSRYMQAAANASNKPMRATDRTLLNSTNATMLKPKKTGGYEKKSQSRSVSSLRDTSGTKRRDHSGSRSDSVGKRPKSATRPTLEKTVTTPGNTSNFSTSPEPKGKGSSTPTCEGAPIHSMVDVSAIHSTPDGFDSTCLKPRLTNISSRSHNTREMSSMSSVDSTRSEGVGHSQPSKKSLEAEQFQLDMIYARYLQWVFLESKGKKAFHEQEKDVMCQAYGMWELNEKMRQRKYDLQQQIQKVQQINALEEMLDVQESALVSVVSNLPNLQHQYTTLSQALDTTRHQIPTKGIYIPDDEEQFHNALQHDLQESEHLLGEISAMMRQQEPKVTNFAGNLHAMKKAVKSEAKELNRCNELLSAVQTLTVQESSLHIQEKQLNG